MQENTDRQPFPSQDTYAYMMEQMQRRMDDNDHQRAQAISKQSEAYEKAIELQSENQEKRIQEMASLFNEKISAGDSELGVRIESIKEAGNKLASERDRAAEALREANQRALTEASVERSKSADRLADQLREKIESGYENLRQHIRQQEQELSASRREMTIIHAGSEKAISKAEAASEKRFEAVNEFRAQLNDQAKDFMPREVADAQIKELDKRISVLQQSQDTSAGKDIGSDKTVAYIVTAAGLVLTAVVVVVNVILS